MAQSKTALIFIFAILISANLYGQKVVFNPDYVLLNGQEVNPTEYSVEITKFLILVRRGEARSTLLIDSRKTTYTQDGSIETFDCVDFMVNVHRTKKTIHHITAIGPKATLILSKE